MRKSNKKGFTVVELVIVIAIIAILAAVLIPTFAGLIQKANESKDTQLVKNLNTALAADNKEHKTMTDALDAAAAFGYDVGKINASATGNEILWDSKNDVFCYLKNGNVEYIPETNLKNGAVAANETYMLWKIYTSEAKVTEDVNAGKFYSIYWNSDANFTQTLTVGFDAGKNTAITELTYTGVGTEQKVVIRTNDLTVLTVNAEFDTVYHYGEAGSVDVIKCAMASYHEFGAVAGNINLAQGRVELESGSSISNVVVKALGDVVPTAGNVKVTVANDADVTLILSEVSGVTAAVEGEGAADVAVLEQTTDIAAIGSTTYSTLDEAISAAKAGDTITLLKDASLTSSYTTIEKEITIDLNGKKLETSAVTINGGAFLTVKNGEFLSTETASSGRIGFNVKANAGLTLSQVSYSGATYGIYPSGDASYVNILNSSISTVAGIATNASGTLSNNVKITIESSTIDCTEIAAWINVPGSCMINNSVLKGGCQALMVRAGTAVVTNSELILNKVGDNTFDDQAYLSGNAQWGQGNSVPYGALIVGDYAGAYNYTASCTLSNTKVSTTYDGWTRALIVLSQDGANETILNYDSACKIAESDYTICNYTVDGLKKGQISVNGAVVREREN